MEVLSRTTSTDVDASPATAIESTQSSGAVELFPTVRSVFTNLGERYGFAPRRSQIKLANLTKRAIELRSVVCAEAPTGTGKTMGYLTGSLEAQAHSAEPKPIVVCTGTVSLQSQIMVHDIPRLVEAGAIRPSEVGIAKGRGRYFCPRMAESLEEGPTPESQIDLFSDGEQEAVSQRGVQISLDMLHAWRNKEWDGDRDNWGGPIPDCWDLYCNATAETCVNRACEYMEECPFMRSRARLSQVKLIVANQDLVLADLLSRAEAKEAGESRTHVLPVKDYDLIIDEAHNFPEKAVDLQRADYDLKEMDWLMDFGPYCETANAIPAVQNKLSTSPVALEVRADTLASQLEALSEEVAKLTFDKSGYFNWKMSPVEDVLRNSMVSIAQESAEMVKDLEMVLKEASSKVQDTQGAERSHLIRFMVETNQLMAKTQTVNKVFYSFAFKPELVKWAEVDEEGESLKLSVQPLEGAEVLKSILWDVEDSPRAVVMTSATMQIAGSFNRFKDKAGLFDDVECHALPAAFDYGRAMLHLPEMKTDPSHPLYEKELAIKLRALHHGQVGPGMLVLFTSRESMRRVAKSISPEMQDILLMQGEMGVPEMVRTHRKRIDEGKQSIMFGLNSLAEGLDLPGGYCSHLVITRLPFGVPTHPVEVARKEALGFDTWFNQAYLADMSIDLIQSCGRLMRRESDHGVISIMDTRISTKKYSPRVFAALPGFTYRPKLRDYKELAKERGFDMSFGIESTVVTAVSAPTPARTEGSKGKKYSEEKIKAYVTALCAEISDITKRFERIAPIKEKIGEGAYARVKAALFVATRKEIQRISEKSRTKKGQGLDDSPPPFQRYTLPEEPVSKGTERLNKAREGPAPFASSEQPPWESSPPEKSHTKGEGALEVKAFAFPEMGEEFVVRDKTIELSFEQECDEFPFDNLGRVPDNPIPVWGSISYAN